MITFTFISLLGFLRLQRFTSMVRLFFGAAIHKTLSKKLGTSLLSLVSPTGSGRQAGAWTANAGPEGKKKVIHYSQAPFSRAAEEI